MSNFCSFYTDTPTRAWIIGLSIRARPARHRRSRAGKNLFYYIATITNSHQCDAVICIRLLGKTKESPLPPGYTNKELADRFNNYFIYKIIKIHTNLTGKCQHLPPNVEIPAPQRYRSLVNSNQSPFPTQKRSSCQHQTRTVILI